MVGSLSLLGFRLLARICLGLLCLVVWVRCRRKLWIVRFLVCCSGFVGCSILWSPGGLRSGEGLFWGWSACWFLSHIFRVLMSGDIATYGTKLFKPWRLLRQPYLISIVFSYFGCMIFVLTSFLKVSLCSVCTGITAFWFFQLAIAGQWGRIPFPEEEVGRILLKVLRTELVSVSCLFMLASRRGISEDMEVIAKFV